jgi:hypothetical protein
MFLLLTMGIPSTGLAVSYEPPFRLTPVSGSEVVKGGTLYLFHSGTHDIKDAVRSGDILIVYRITHLCKMEEVGKIRFLNFVRDTYMEAEVIEGVLKAGDIAKKGNISCLIVSTEPCTR